MKKLRLNAKLRRALWGRSRGFSLIEVVIAIALVGIIGVTILSAMSAATLALIIADQRASAESLARSQMEFVKELTYIDYSEPGHQEYGVMGGEPPENYDIDITVTPLNPQNYEPYGCNATTGVCAGDDGLQMITVAVTYYTLRGDNQMREQTYTLEDYKVSQEIEG